MTSWGIGVITDASLDSSSGLGLLLGPSSVGSMLSLAICIVCLRVRRPWGGVATAAAVPPVETFFLGILKTSCWCCSSCYPDLVQNVPPLLSVSGAVLHQFSLLAYRVHVCAALRCLVGLSRPSNIVDAKQTQEQQLQTGKLFDISIDHRSRDIVFCLFLPDARNIITNPKWAQRLPRTRWWSSQETKSS